MASITSRKIGYLKGKSATHLKLGAFSKSSGIILSGRSLLLNLPNGERLFTIFLDPAETSELTERVIAYSNIG